MFVMKKECELGTKVLLLFVAKIHILFLLLLTRSRI